jgi:uncharacterized protein (TIGR02118 family)
VITRVGMAPRAAGLSYEQFASHWRTQHATVASALPGMRAYVQNHAILAGGRPLLPYPGFDACSQLVFDDEAGMEAALATRTPDSELRQDELRMIEPARLMAVIATPETVLEGSALPDSAVKLMTFVRAAPAVDPDALGSRLDATAQATGTAGGTILRRERLTAILGASAEATPAWCDAIDVIWFAGAEGALAYLASPVSDDEDWRLAAFGQVLGRRIATEVWVVGG